MGGTPGLRPLSFGEILDVALKIFGRHWRTLVACVLVPTIPIQIVSVLVILAIAPEQYDPNTSPTAAPEGTGTEIAAILVVQVLSLIATLLAWAACFKAVGDGYLGRQPSLGGSLRFGLPRIPRLFGLSVVTGVMIIVGLFGCLVGALFVAALVMLSVPALLLERIGVFAAIGRSFELVKGRYWQMVLMLLVIFVGLLAITVVLGVVLGAVSGAGDASETANAVVSFIASVAASAITTPIFASILTVLYFDQRVRKEGFDLQRLAEGFGEQAPATAQQPWQQPRPEPWQQPQPDSGQPQQQPQPDSGQSWQQPQPESQPGWSGSSGWQPPSAPPSSPPGPSTPPPGSSGGS